MEKNWDLIAKCREMGFDNDNLTREQAVAVVGEAEVVKAEYVGCEFHQVDRYGDQVWTAHHQIGDCWLTVVYVQTDESFINPHTGEGYEDLGKVDWNIDHYRLTD